jgi:thioredoxin-dependent peroxiredoxin
MEDMKAPDFSLPDQDGKMHSLKDYAGKWLVLYFYPEDDTAGCTLEACNFRDARELIAELGDAVVVGISKDTVESHKAFMDKYKLNFTLLSDPEHKTIIAYDSWGVMMAKRNTFIIDPEGEIVKEYKGVEPNEHAAHIIEDLKQLQAQ